MVSLIKELCASKKTTIKALERELGLGNGTIRRWDDSSPAYEKLQKVAAYFGITVAELTGEEQKETHALPQENELDSVEEVSFMVERIRVLCRKNGTSITKLEAQLGFGNGAIGKWKKTKPPYERVQLVAEALGVTPDYILTGKEINKPAPEGELDEKRKQLIQFIRTTDDKMIDILWDIAERVKSSENK